MALTQVLVISLALSILALTLTWICYFDEGLGFQKSHTSTLFAWHPLLMTVAYVVCMPVAAVQYRHPLLRASRHITRKVFHASLHTVGLVALVLAIAAVVLSKVWNMPARGHMYTVHSYIGAATVALSLVQFLWALGFVKALGLSERARFTLAAYHRPLGFGITIAGLTTVLSGFNEVQVLHMSPRDSHYAGGVVILSVIGLAVLVLLMATVAALFQPAAKGHDSSDQFVTAPKADMRASAPGIPV